MRSASGTDAAPGSSAGGAGQCDAAAAGPRDSRVSLPAIVLVCLVLQIAAIGLLHTYRQRAQDDHFGYGWEMGKIGQAIALGRGFSNPFGLPTGPSAWEPPLYPYWIGGVFKVFGIYSSASAWVLLTVNSLFNALTCIPIYFIARRAMGERVARWSAWTWALLPYTWYWAIHWIWDTTISPFLLSVIFLAALMLAERGKAAGLWTGFGLLWGVAALLNPSCLSFLPACLLWIGYRRRRNGQSVVAGTVCALLLMTAVMAPWLMRNYQVFGKFVFVRDDFGQQLRLSNGPFSDGTSMVYLQPNLDPGELKRFRRLGEVEYAEQRKREALQFIRENPRRFAAITLNRIVYYWYGVQKRGEGMALTTVRSAGFLASSILAWWGLGRALRQRKPGAWLFAWLVLSYPAVYYVVYPHARYRHPIEPELLILAVFLAAEAGRQKYPVPKGGAQKE
jgi:4-amino-4-deoxy-L-arabinose transferase-like glycosyltransferase